MKLLVVLLRNQIGDIDGSAIGVEMLCDYLLKRNVQFDVFCGKSSTKKKYKINSYLNTAWRDVDLFRNTYTFINAVNKIKDKYSHLYIVLPNPSFSIVADLIKHSNKTVRFESSLHYFKRPRWSLSKSYVYYALSCLINSGFLCRFSSRSANKYIVSTNFQKKELIKKGFDKDKTFISMNPSLQVSNKTRDINLKNKVFAYVGHANYVKGLDVLIRAAQIVINEKGHKDIKFELAIASDYFHYSEIKKLIIKFRIEKNIKLKRIVSIDKFLQNARAIILPYRYSFGTQILPNIILESIQVNIPMITTRIEVLEEILTDGHDCILVEPENPSELADAIVRIKEDKKLYKKIKCNMTKLSDIANAKKASEKIYSLIIS